MHKTALPRNNPVKYWIELGAAYREYALCYSRTAASKALMESLALECEVKAAEAAAARAFD